MKRSYLLATEAEMEMQSVRELDGFTGKMEKDYISRMIKDAKRNSMVGDKLQLVVDPMYIHIPEWQRRITIAKSLQIGTSYNKYKWDVPKVLFNNGKLYVVDGQHRVYGAFKAGIDSVVVEIMECELSEAIDLFLNQTKDRTRMQPMDIYNAAIASGKKEYIALRDICHKHNVAVKGEDNSGRVGTFTCISDGVKMDSKTLDSILSLLGRLEWNGYADTYNGKAYTAKIIRSMKSLYAYFAGREKLMEDILVLKCKGTSFFTENIMEMTQAQIFDSLSSIVAHEMTAPKLRNIKAI